MANAYVEMDAKKYVKFMKESMAAKARAQNFKRARVRLTEVDAPTLAQQLYSLLGKFVTLNTTTTGVGDMSAVADVVNSNIGMNFQSLSNFVGNVKTGAGNFFFNLTSKVRGWLANLGKAVTTGAKWMQNPSTVKFGGMTLSNGTLVALAVLAAVVLIAGYKFIKGLAAKSDQENTNNQNQTQNVQQNQNAQTNNAQTNNAQPAEGTLYDSELQSYLDEGTKYTNEIMDLFNEQTELNEGLFDMFTWLGKMVRKAAGMVKEMFGYVGKFIKQHPIIAVLVLVCIFFILFCTPGLTMLLGNMANAGAVQSIVQ